MSQVQAGLITRSDIAKISDDPRIIKWLDTIQQLVFNSPFNNLGDAVSSATVSNTSIPIVINDIQYYLKLSTTP